MKLPTLLARKLLKDHISVRMGKPIDVNDALAEYQKMAVVGLDIETCIAALNVWVKPSHQINLNKLPPNAPEYLALKSVFELTSKDVLGCAVDTIMGIMDAPVGSTKDKLAAAAVINELYGEKELIKDEMLTDRLMINLVGKGS